MNKREQIADLIITLIDDKDFMTADGKHISSRDVAVDRADQILSILKVSLPRLTDEELVNALPIGEPLAGTNLDNHRMYCARRANDALLAKIKAENPVWSL